MIGSPHNVRKLVEVRILSVGHRNEQETRSSTGMKAKKKYHQGETTESQFLSYVRNGHDILSTVRFTSAEF